MGVPFSSTNTSGSHLRGEAIGYRFVNTFELGEAGGDTRTNAERTHSPTNRRQEGANMSLLAAPMDHYSTQKC
ncbi:hypothetical protein SVAN01_07855 [Stagonosporopsis vannaccii]|nr:hypothetical protein SVAN01_07855 [Stagonosporopsis vannaccii]